MTGSGNFAILPVQTCHEGARMTPKKKAEEKAAEGSQGGPGSRLQPERVREARPLGLYGKYYLGTAASGHDLWTDLGAAKAIEAGVPTDAVDEVIESGLVEANVVYDLVVPRRTLAHRKSKGQTLTPEESDRLARVLRVYARSEEALGDGERAHRWMRKPNRALNGRTPLELLSSEAGARAVEKVLGRIEHGIFS